MNDKFKKLNKKYVLSDSTVNEYGFRLLTDGYQLEAFQKNPIGYYMHRREDGVALKWEELCVEEDKVIGTPVINLSNPRGEQLYDEAENGFLNAASVGHIVVLEHSFEPELMLPGQTGPTITKWYNKECSLVDIPGNCNALIRLYDEQENELNLLDLNIKPAILRKTDINADLHTVLQLADDGDEQNILLAVKDLVARSAELENANTQLHADKAALQQQLDDIRSSALKSEVTQLLEQALDANKINNDLKDKLADDYAAKPEALKALLQAMPVYRPLTEQLKLSDRHTDESTWGWDDYKTKDASGKKLEELKTRNNGQFQKIFDEKFKS